eukprot:jgi/Tetstr1/430072/TSEL_019930.t1
MDDRGAVATYTLVTGPAGMPQAPQPPPPPASAEGDEGGECEEQLNRARVVHERPLPSAAHQPVKAAHVHRAVQIMDDVEDHASPPAPASRPPQAQAQQPLPPRETAPPRAHPPASAPGAAAAAAQAQALTQAHAHAQAHAQAQAQVQAAAVAQQYQAEAALQFAAAAAAALPSLAMAGQPLAASADGIAAAYRQHPPQPFQHSQLLEGAGMSGALSALGGVEGSQSLRQPGMSLPAGFPSLSPPAGQQGQQQVLVQHVFRPRWRPTPEQVQLLERHFREGHTKPTKELTEAVMKLGEATEQQVLVWLKNRLARKKRDVPAKGDAKEGGKSAGNGTSPEWEALNDTLKQSGALLGIQADAAHAVATAVSGEKRDHKGNPAAGNKCATNHQAIRTASMAIQELGTCMMTMDMVAMEELLQEMGKARHLYVYGVGREGLIMKAWVFRLNQLKLKAFYIGEAVCPPLSSGDLLVTSAGPAYYGTVAAMCNEARAYGAKTAAFTANPTAVLTFADLAVRIPAHCPSIHDAPVRRRNNRNSSQSGYDKPSSVLLLGGQYELALHLVTDVMTTCIFQDSDIGEEAMRGHIFNVN